MKSQQNETSLLDVATEAARKAGKVLVEGFGQLQSRQISMKGRGDYVTDLDHRSDRIIIDCLMKRFPDHGILTEESREHRADSPFRWIVDPLDGTANYVQGIPYYAVSIALFERDEPRLGVIYHPDRDDMFTAERGQGAFLNGQPIRVSSKQEMSYAMLASGFPWRSKPFLKPYMASFEDLFLQAAGLRRLGAAALDLAYTACGRLDGFWEMKLKPWDIAAGVLLVEEAGGTVTDFQGGNAYMKSGNVVASNRTLHSRLVDVTRQHLSCLR